MECTSFGKSQILSPFSRFSQMTTTSKALHTSKRWPLPGLAFLTEETAKQEIPEEIRPSSFSGGDSWIQPERVLLRDVLGTSLRFFGTDVPSSQHRAWRGLVDLPTIFNGCTPRSPPFSSFIGLMWYRRPVARLSGADWQSSPRRT